MTNPVWKADLDIVADFIMALLELPSDEVTQTLENTSSGRPTRPSPRRGNRRGIAWS